MGFVAEHAYFAWFDLARATLLREQGFDHQAFAAEGYLFPVLEIGLTFRQPARCDEALEVVTTLRGRPKFLIRLDYEVRRGESVVATAFTQQGFVNRSLRPVRPPAAFLAKLDQVFPRPPLRPDSSS